MPLIWSKWAADMTKNLCRSLNERLEMVLHIREQQVEGATTMIMGHDSTRDAPEPFDAVRIRIIGRSVHQIQLFLELAEQTAHKQGASRSVGPKIIGNHDGNPSTLLGTSHSSTHLLTEHISRASRRNTAIEPAITPVHQAKAVDLAIVPRRLYQALPSSPFATPYTCEGWVKGNLYFILQIEISAWYKREQIWQVGRKLSPQISLDQIMNG